MNLIHWRTMLATSYRTLTEVVDWQSHVRCLSGQPILDCVFITNMRDEIDRERFLGTWRPACGHFNGPRYWIKGVSGRTRALNITTDDLASSGGRARARHFVINAVLWAQAKGAQVILLAASTKRLFGEDARQLKELFPEMIFTIGDNGTMVLLIDETLRAFKKAKLTAASRVAILGPYGFLGEHLTQALTKKGYQVVGVGTNKVRLKKVNAQYNISTYNDLFQVGKVDAVVACTHSKQIQLTEEAIESLVQTDKKLLVIDVAEPSNLKRSVYKNMKRKVIRQDAGNAYSPYLNYVLEPISYKLFRLTRGVTFGCFAEALSLAWFVKRQPMLKNINWMKVSKKNMDLVKIMFAAMGFTAPTPKNYGKEIKSFDLNIYNGWLGQIKNLVNPLTNFF